MRSQTQLPNFSPRFPHDISHRPRSLRFGASVLGRTRSGPSEPTSGSVHTVDVDVRTTSTGVAPQTRGAAAVVRITYVVSHAPR
jgi:hypothetical protein